MSNLTKRGTERVRAAKGHNNRPTEFGTTIRNARMQKQLSQTELGKVLEKQAKTVNGNSRLSIFELGKAIPNDAELTVIARELGLSVATLRTKRDEAGKLLEARRKAGRKRGAEKLKEIRKAKREGMLLAPKAPERTAAKRVSAQDAAGVPVLADFVETIDGLSPMPKDKEARRRWFAATMELFKINGGSS